MARAIDLRRYGPTGPQGLPPWVFCYACHGNFWMESMSKENVRMDAEADHRAPEEEGKAEAKRRALTPEGREKCREAQRRRWVKAKSMEVGMNTAEDTRELDMIAEGCPNVDREEEEAATDGNEAVSR